MPEAKKVKIRGKQYVMPRPEDLKRKQAKKLKVLMQTMHEDKSGLSAMDAPWDMLETVIPDLPEHVLDDLTIEECQNIMIDAGFVESFDTDAETVSLGESSASSTS